jgi:simple sugar transport system permease protein
LALVLSIAQSKTKFGMELYLVGTNPLAAEFSGINCTKTIMKTYALSGFLSAIAGLILTSRSMSAKVDYGSIYQLQAILAVVLSGTSPSGGFGKISGVIMAVFTLQILSTGMNILRLSSTTFVKNLIWGILLLGVLVINFILQRRKEHKLIKKLK